ncbi:MAG: 23S rRNA (uridine(2552)-2'-O)-methyltransferase RlmE [Thiotrichales bacterium]
MARSKSSRRWLDEHFSDEFVRRAQTEGYRSRAVFKLLELDERYRLLKPGMMIVDLGAAPGGWSQVVARKLGRNARVIASDILPMEPIEGVEFVQGDFCEDTALDRIAALLAERRADLVLSDMAPNMSGAEAVDIPRAMYLAELAADMALKVLRPGGGFLVKLFQGEGFDDYLRLLRQNFEGVILRKPKASRPRSREIYALATNRKI